MKQKILWTTAFIIVVFISWSCSSQEPNHSVSQINSIEKYDVWGEIHNEMLSGIKEGFRNNMTRSLSENDSLLYAKLHTSLLSQVDSTESLIQEEKIEWKTYMNSHKNLYVEDFLATKVGTIQAYDDSGLADSEISQQFNYALENRIITKREKKILDDIMICIIKNKNYHLPVSKLYYDLLKIKGDWNHNYAGRFTTDGEYSAIILSIALKSCEWWMDNLEVIDDTYITRGDENGPARIAPWVAADIAGAVLGTGTYVLTTKLTEGQLSWKNGAVSVAVSATMASCGVVAKATGWIVKVFK